MNEIYLIDKQLIIINSVQILETLVGYLDYESKKSSRLVCTKWNEIVLPQFLKSASLNIQFDIDRLFILENELTSTFHRVPEEESERFTCVNIHSMKWLNSLIFRNWISDYGKSFKVMTLGKGEDDDVDDLEEVEEISLDDLQTLLLIWCPNLKELKLPIPCIKDYQLPDLNSNYIQQFGSSSLKILLLGSSKWFKDDYEDIGIIARFVFQVAPNLKVLTMNSCQKRGVDLLLNNIRENPIAQSLEKLTTLDLHKQLMNRYIVDELAKVSFVNLQKFGLGDVGEVENSALLWSSVSRLLTNVSSTLEDLSFGETYHGSIPVGDIPTMPKLITFVNHHLRGWTMRNFDFLISFPNLEHCILDSRCVDFCGHAKWLFEPEESFPNIRLLQQPHIKLLSLAIKCGIRDMTVLENIVSCFPNLESLRAKLMFKVTDQCVEELIRLKKLQKLWIEISPSINTLAASDYLMKFPGILYYLYIQQL